MSLRDITLEVQNTGEIHVVAPCLESEAELHLYVAKIQEAKNVSQGYPRDVVAWETLVQTCIELAKEMDIGGKDFAKPIVSHLGAALAIFDRAKMSNLEYIKSLQGRVVTNENTPTQENQ